MSFARQTIRGRGEGHSNRPSTAPSPHRPPGSGRTIRILIQTTNGRVVPVEPNSTDSVARLKQLVEAKAGGGHNQSLTFDGRELVDRKTLDQYNIKIGSRLLQKPGICARGASPTRRPYTAPSPASSKPAWGAGPGGTTQMTRTKKKKKKTGLGSGRFTPSQTGPTRTTAHVDESLFGSGSGRGGITGTPVGSGAEDAVYNTNASTTGADGDSGSNSPAWPGTQRTSRTSTARRPATTTAGGTRGGRRHYASTSSRPPSSAGSSYRRPSSAASSRAGTARPGSSRRVQLDPGKPQVKSKAYVDETLFGEPSVQSAEELHKQMWAGTKPFWKANEVVDGGPKRTKARKSTRCDFDAPVELPAGPAGDGRRFQKTSTLKGGHDAPRYARPADNKPSSVGASLIAHKPQSRRSRQPGGGNTKAIASPFVHNNNKFAGTAKPAARLVNTIYASFPNT